MAYDPANLSSTPAGYQTPEQIQQLYDYSKKLTEGGMRDQTITSPWQGVRMMADALSGGYMRNKAQQAQIQNQQLLGNQQTDAMGKMFQPYQQYPAAPGNPTGTSTSNVNPVAAMFTPPPNPYSVG